MKDYTNAAQAYQTYLTLRPAVIDSYVQALPGDALSARDDYSDALSAYEAAQSAPHLDDAFALQIKIGQMRTGIGDYATAISIYTSILSSTSNDYTKSQMDYLLGEANLTLNKTDVAYGFFRDAIANYWFSSWTWLCLNELVNANVSVNDLDRGLTDYYAGYYQYTPSPTDTLSAALNALSRYIAANPGNDGTAHYTALTLRELQKYPMRHLNYILHPELFNQPGLGKWLDSKGDTQWNNIHDSKAATDTLLAFVKSRPLRTRLRLH